jgi:hypothetical protein
VCRVVALCVACLAGGAADARAEFDFPWLEKLSGPGPFWGVEVNYRYYCRVGEAAASPRGTWMGPLEPGGGIINFGDDFDETTYRSAKTAKALCLADHKVRAYATVGFHAYRAVRNDLAVDPARNNVHFLGGDWKWSIRLDEALDLSTGIGLSVFGGEGFERFARVRWQPLEVRFYPFVIDRDNHDNLRRRALYVTAGVLTFLPGMREQDFCGGPCAVPFREEPEALTKFGVHVDLAALGALFNDRSTP